MYISFRIKNIKHTLWDVRSRHIDLFKKKKEKKNESNFLIFIYFSIIYTYIKHYFYYSTWKNFIPAWISAQYRNFSRVPSLYILRFHIIPRRTTGLNRMNETISHHSPIICLDDGYLKSCDVSSDTWWYFIILKSNFSYRGRARLHKNVFLLLKNLFFQFSSTIV